AEYRVVPAHHAIDRLGVGIEQKFPGIEPMTRAGFVRTGHTIAVAQPRAGLREVAVPDLVVAFLEPDARELAIAVGVVEQAELDAGGVLREQGEVDSRPVPRRTQRIGGSRPQLHAHPRRVPDVPRQGHPEHAASARTPPSTARDGPADAAGMGMSVASRAQQLIRPRAPWQFVQAFLLVFPTAHAPCSSCMGPESRPSSWSSGSRRSSARGCRSHSSLRCWWPPSGQALWWAD